MNHNNIEQILLNNHFAFYEDGGVWALKNQKEFLYNDGDAAENYLLDSILESSDLSVNSSELFSKIKDWPSLYHLTSKRSNLLKPFQEWFSGKNILEIGCGCGAITRFLAESGANVVSVEGSFRRARIAKARNRDLDNVTVICTSSNDLPDLGQFDAVMLIGVLEYARTFLGENGQVKLLQFCNKKLKTNGKLFLAIENKLGIKYFAGAPEDHLGLPMAGINNNYTSSSVATFGRTELLDLLKISGFNHHIDEFLPYPDYKLPKVVVSPLGWSKFNNELFSLVNENLHKDPQLQDNFHFSLEEANKNIWENKLAQELSNSFLMIASKESYIPNWSTNTAAWYYGEPKNKNGIDDINKTIIFTESNDRLQVKNILGGICNASSSVEEFTSGGTHWNRLLNIVNKPDWSIDEVASWVLEWMGELTQFEISGNNDLNHNTQLRSEAIDALPFNLFVNGNQKYFFDLEWIATKPISLGYVVYRGLYHSFARITSVAKSVHIFDYKIISIAEKVLAKIFSGVTFQLLNDFANTEAEYSVIFLLGNYNDNLNTLLTNTIRIRHTATDFNNINNENSILMNEVDVLTSEVDVLTSEVDVLTSEVDVLRSEAEVLTNRISNLINEVDAIRVSNSWRITAPLRYTSKNVNRVKNATAFSYKLIKKFGFKQTAEKAIRIYKQGGLRAINTHFKHAYHRQPHADSSFKNDYAYWYKQYNSYDCNGIAELKKSNSLFSNRPVISIVMPVYNPKLEWLIEVIDSVINQTYENWQLCIADDCSTNPEVIRILKEKEQEDSRIQVIYRVKNGHISEASNSALSVATGEWVALLDHDDILPEFALHFVVKAINENPNGKIFYSDEDKINEQGVLFEPYFKSDWNRTLFYSHNMISHFGVYQKELLKGIGGFSIGLEGSQDYDLALRCIECIDDKQIIHIPKVLYHWRVHAESTAKAGVTAKPYAALAGELALNNHFKRINLEATATLMDNGAYRVHYDVLSPMPLVSIIIPTRNGKDLVKQCIDSIQEKTNYKNYEVILIDNGSDNQDAIEYFELLNQQDNITVIHDDSPFNYSYLNNMAVRQANGDMICLLNNDIEVISPGWLESLVTHAVLPGVGAVGAKLYYPDDTIQHAGVVLGIGGVAGHIFKYTPHYGNTYFNWTNISRECLAVTAACLVIKKSIFEEVGGFNEKDLTVAFNDVDLCLKVYQAGYRNVWTPFAELYHHESVSRGLEDTPEKLERFNREIKYMQNQWAGLIQNDPMYNPNLTLKHKDCSLRWD